MKKMFLLICAMLWTFTGCTMQEQSTAQPVTYSFTGAHEAFVINDGKITLSEETIEVDAGCFTKNVDFPEIVSYTMTVFLSDETGEHVLLSNALVDQTGNTVNPDGKIGTISGPRSGKETLSAEKIRDSLFFELEATDLSGEIRTYRIPLEVSEIPNESTQ